jgi:hypothetical protein
MFIFKVENLLHPVYFKLYVLMTRKGFASCSAAPTMVTNLRSWQEEAKELLGEYRNLSSQ